VKIALLCNERPDRLPTGLPEDAFAEYDTPDTLEAIAAALEVAGASVERVPADRRLPWRLDAGRFDFAFNVAEGEGRRCREAVPAAVCELLGLPSTGPDALTLAVTLDKAMARRVVAPDVPSARAVLWEGPETPNGALDALSYPAIVKPNDEVSSKGIGAGAVAEGPRDAEAKCRRLFETYGCPVLVEEFLPGAEVTVGILGNGAEARVLGMMEIAPAEPLERFVYSRELKREYRSLVRYSIPPRIPAAASEAIARRALAAYRLLGCRDAARLDFRLDASGEPLFLECNALPGLDHENSDLVILSRGILEHGDLVRGIFADAARRQSVALPACAS
jgi:D-alanine-D-alanine ligase